MAKLRLFVRVRGVHGAYVSSVPVKELVRLSGYCKRRWSFDGVVLVLEAF
jgi:hypothetical protein